MIKNSYFTRSFTRSRTILTLWYIAFCLALIALLNFGAFSAQTASLATPTKTINFGTAAPEAPPNTVSFQNDQNQEVTTTIDGINKRFGQQLIIVDSVLILCAAVFSYILSGLTLQPIRKTLREQEEFAQEVSHELRTPLSVVALEIETLKRGGSKAIPAVASNIQGELGRMNQLVDGLLTLVRPQNSQQHAQATKFNITNAAYRVFEQYKKLAAAKNLVFTFESHYKGLVYAQESDIAQCLGILLDNAIKYTSKKGTVRLVITAHSNNTVEISIRDTGEGIPKQDLPHIFDRFYRAEHREQNDAGLGLGLAIAQKRIAANNGRITLESALGQGTTASIQLPLR